jgi:ribulose 1,5-bisphosphate synthetase/thiazole synthase
MRFRTLALSSLALGSAAANWATKAYDVIVVGAGPAGIIGMLCFHCCCVCCEWSL